jgi:hypothetical protein
MADETPRPKRKRWRWIIAGVLLFVASLAGWWYWPRGDARFVGVWLVSIDGGKVMGRMTFASNGAGFQTPGNSGAKIHFPWSFDGKTLTLGSSSPSMATRFFNPLLGKVLALTGSSVMVEAFSLKVLEIDKDNIGLIDPEAGTTYELKRLPE